MDLQIKDKVAFISGSTAGIGFATAKVLLQEGATVIVNGRYQSRVDHAIARLRAQIPSGNVSGLVADFTKNSQIVDLLGQLGEIDILINNVGVYLVKPFIETSDKEWYEQFEINVMSAVRLSRHCLPIMLKQNWGRILFVSSECVSLTPTNSATYNMTKTALLSISRTLAEMTKGSEVTVNAVLPGSTLSEGAELFLKNEATKQQKSPQEIEKSFFKEVRTSSLLQRFAKVEEVASTLSYLCSPRAAATNGAAIKIDGGSSGGIL